MMTPATLERISPSPGAEPITLPAGTYRFPSDGLREIPEVPGMVQLSDEGIRSVFPLLRGGTITIGGNEPGAWFVDRVEGERAFLSRLGEPLRCLPLAEMTRFGVSLPILREEIDEGCLQWVKAPLRLKSWTPTNLWAVLRFDDPRALNIGIAQVVGLTPGGDFVLLGLIEPEIVHVHRDVLKRLRFAFGFTPATYRVYRGLLGT